MSWSGTFSGRRSLAEYAVAVETSFEKASLKNCVCHVESILVTIDDIEQSLLRPTTPAEMAFFDEQNATRADLEFKLQHPERKPFFVRVDFNGRESRAHLSALFYEPADSSDATHFRSLVAEFRGLGFS